MSQSFIEHFSIIEDPRIERCKKHQLMEILFLSLCAVRSGAEGWEDIEDFGTAKLDWLRKYLPFTHGIPKHDTIARVLSRLNPAHIQQCFINWVKAVAAEDDARVIAIDGKTARRIVERGGDYVLALKGNQGPLREEIKSWFHRAERDKLSQVKYSQFTETDSGHGRIESRSCLQLALDPNWVPNACCKSFACIGR